MLQVSPVRAFSDNYIWLIRAPADPAAAVVVDPGDDSPVEQASQAQGLQLGAILVTHHHADHVGGVRALAARHGAPVFGPAREQMPCAVQALDDGGKASLENLGLEFDVLAVPGHTLGHIAYAGHGALFCGDTLFSVGCGRLFEGTPAQMLDSLDRLAALPDATRVFVCHDYGPGGRAVACETSIGAEKSGNIHLRTGLAQADFVALREARDATLAAPTLLLPSIQVNIRAGKLPPADCKGVHYLRIPVRLTV